MAHLLDLHESFDFPPEADVNKARSTLPPEIEEGNIEYKLKLINPSKTRLEHLTTQLKWRLQEGQGEAIYEIGVENNGLLAGLTREEMNLSLETLTKMAEKLGSEATVLREQIVEQLVDGVLTEENQKIVAEVLVRKVPDDQQFIDIRLAVLGNVDVGKSTILGVLTQGELDNGRGRARLNLFRHLHEIESGRTSSISHEILGFDSKGQVVNYSHSGSAEEICEVSSKIITFLDLAGHQKYLKTTIFGLTGHIPDFAMLVVAANAGVVGTFREHLGLCMALEVPMFIVINKTDICTPAMTERTMKSLERVLKSPGCRKVVVYVQNKDDAIAAATNLISNKTTPIFTVSSVTGQNLDILKQFLNMIPPRQSQEEQERLMQEMPEYLVDETFKVPGTGLVVGGTLMRGVIREGDTMMLGPSGTGEYNQSKVMSIRRNRAPCRLIKAGQSATLALSGVDKAFIRRGMALLSPNSSLGCSSGLEASLFLLFHTSELTERFQGTLHVGKIVQRVVIKKISSQRLKTGQWATVTFEFLRNPEFIRTGSKIFFRQGRTKAMGTISRTIPYCSETIER